MNKYYKLVVWIYFGLFILCIITPIDYPQKYYLFSYCLHFLVLLSFSIGCLGKSKIVRSYEKKKSFSLYISDCLSFDITRLWLFALISLVFVALYVKFYTGSAILDLLITFISGSSGQDSTYYMYQSYFAESNLGVWSWKKLPYILGYGFLKFIYASLMVCLSVSHHNNRKAIPPVVVMTFAFLMVGLSRGTSLEMFEVFTLLIFCYLVSNRRVNQLSARQLFPVFVIVIFAILYFIRSLSVRYEGGIITNGGTSTTFVFNDNSFVAMNFPLISMILRRLSGYFVFGFYYISHAFNDVWVNSSKEFLALLLPNGLSVLGIAPSTQDVLCGRVIDCGAMWIPDIVLWIQQFGLILTLLFVFLMGKLFKYLCGQLLGSKLFIYGVVLYFITIQMASFQVGNFLSSSSPTQFSIILSIVALLFPHHYTRFFLKFFSK